VDPEATSLERFLIAQEPVYHQVLAELSAGYKTSHWMWFVFPQLRGLGRSTTARFYGIDSKAEALAYWQHPVLGARLRSCAQCVLEVSPGKSAHDIFGSPDDLKFRSCLTLFQQVAPKEASLNLALVRFYGGLPDPRTLELLAGVELPRS
jgi:uncharacterized protein (DUF1810 family)